MFSEEQDRLFQHLAKCAAAENISIYVVGGAIRDLFLGSKPGDRDIDFLVDGNAIQFAERCLSGLGGTLKRFDDFYTAKILSPNGYKSIDEVDLASARTEIYSIPGALPTVSLAPIEEDLRRRDFTINALAVPLDKLIEWGRKYYGDNTALAKVTLDYFSGIHDLKERIIRIIHDNSFLDDPTRIFRGVRYCIRLGGKFDSASEGLLVSAVQNGALDTISKNRVINELKKMAAERNIASMIRELDRLGVMERLGLYPANSIEKVVNNLGKLDQKFPVLSSKTRFQVLIRVFFAHSLSRIAEQNVRQSYLAYSFGAKEINKIVMETTLSPLGGGRKEYNLDKISDAGIIFQSISDGIANHAILEGELQKRGLISNGV